MRSHDDTLPRHAAPLRSASTDDVVFAALEEATRMLDEGAEPGDVLTHLALSAEAVSGVDSSVSILVLDDEGLLRNGASPALPEDYLAAIDGLRPDPDVGTCAAAAATGEIVLTPDFRADDKWAELRHLPIALGYFGAWSHPIKAQDGRVLGTFGTYYRHSRVPTRDERRAVERLAEAAARVIASSQDAATP